MGTRGSRIFYRCSLRGLACLSHYLKLRRPCGSVIGPPHLVLLSSVSSLLSLGMRGSRQPVGSAASLRVICVRLGRRMPSTFMSALLLRRDVPLLRQNDMRKLATSCMSGCVVVSFILRGLLILFHSDTPLLNLLSMVTQVSPATRWKCRTSDPVEMASEGLLSVLLRIDYYMTNIAFRMRRGLCVGVLSAMAQM